MTTNLDLMISMFISFILIAGILYVSDFSLRDFSKIEKVVIVSIISLIYVLTVIMIKIPTSYIIDKFSASYKTEELTVEVTDKEIVKNSVLRPYVIGKNDLIHQHTIQLQLKTMMKILKLKYLNKNIIILK